MYLGNTVFVNIQIYLRNLQFNKFVLDSNSEAFQGMSSLTQYGGEK